MIKKNALIATVLLSIGVTTAYASVLPWGLAACLQMRYEDDRIDSDSSVGKVRLTLKKSFELGKVSVTPNVYYQYDSYDSFLGTNRKETDTGILFDIVAFNNNAVKVTVSPGYEFQDNAGTNDDGLMILQLKVDL